MPFPKDILVSVAKSQWTEARLALCVQLVDIYGEIETLKSDIRALSDEQRKLVAAEKVQDLKLLIGVGALTFLASTFAPKIVDFILKKRKCYQKYRHVFCMS